MKIAIPVDEKTLNSSICVSFGRAAYFLIYDTETKESKFIENSGANAQGGAGIKAAQTVVDEKAEAVITVRLGENSADVLNAADIKLFKSTDGSAIKNIEMFNSKELSVLTDIHAGFHNHGGAQ